MKPTLRFPLPQGDNNPRQVACSFGPKFYQLLIGLKTRDRTSAAKIANAAVSKLLATKNVKDAIDRYLLSLKEVMPKQVHETVIRFPPSLHKRMTRVRNETGHSLQDIIETAISMVA